jgi:Mlc titration factor MtfA (ptsG expression regulator)
MQLIALTQSTNPNRLPPLQHGQAHLPLFTAFPRGSERSLRSILLFLPERRFVPSHDSSETEVIQLCVGLEAALCLFNSGRRFLH